MTGYLFSDFASCKMHNTEPYGYLSYYSRSTVTNWDGMAKYYGATAAETVFPLPGVVASFKNKSF